MNHDGRMEPKLQCVCDRCASYFILHTSYLTHAFVFPQPLVLAGRAGGGGADLAASAAEAGNGPGRVFRPAVPGRPTRAAPQPVCACGTSCCSRCGCWRLLALVAAFAWPYLRGANTAPVKESRVYILDNTLSHQANDGFRRDRDRS